MSSTLDGMLASIPQEVENRVRGRAVVNPGGADEIMLDLSHLREATQARPPRQSLIHVKGQRGTAFRTPEEIMAGLRVAQEASRQLANPNPIGAPLIATVPTTPPPGVRNASPFQAFQQPPVNHVPPAPTCRVFYEMPGGYDPVEAYYHRILSGPDFLIMVRALGDRESQRFMPSRGAPTHICIEGEEGVFYVRPRAAWVDDPWEYCFLDVLAEPATAPVAAPASPLREAAPPGMFHETARQHTNGHSQVDELFGQ